MEFFPNSENYFFNHNLRSYHQKVIKMKKTSSFFNGFKNGMKNFGNNIAIIINSILLLMVYIIGVGITSIISKIVGKHFLEKKLSKEQKSYWDNLDLSKKPLKDYYRQF